MKTEFYLDAKEARNLGESSYIKRSGAFVGVFKSVRVYEAKTGATNLEIIFVSNDGERAHFKSFCVYKNNGEPNFLKPVLDSILTVFRLRSVSAEKGVYKDENGVQKEGYFLRDLMNKQIGMIFQYAPEEYLKEGVLKVSDKLDILMAFDPETRQNAREILDNLPAERVDRKLATLKDKELKKLDVKSRPAVETTPLDQFEDVPF